MIWFLERESDLVICEIRHSTDGAYEFETARSDRPVQTRRYASASDLIERYLQEHSALRAQGWQPRNDIAAFE